MTQLMSCNLGEKTVRGLRPVPESATDLELQFLIVGCRADVGSEPGRSNTVQGLSGRAWNGIWAAAEKGGCPGPGLLPRPNYGQRGGRGACGARYHVLCLPAGTASPPLKTLKTHATFRIE
jgi:hypothetical protein